MKAAKKKVAEIVSKELGNTWRLALSTYILPEVWGPWETAVQKKVGKNG